jgi:hypothetical protein
MRLYTPGLPTAYARHVIDHGFVGRTVYEVEALDAATRDAPDGEITSPEKLHSEPIAVAEHCEFRNMPPSGLMVSRDTESAIEPISETEFHVTMHRGPTPLDDARDVVLSIEVPDSAALAFEVYEKPPSGRRFRKFWVPEQVANRYRYTLKIIDIKVQPNLLVWQDDPLQTPVSPARQVGDDNAGFASSMRRPRRRWRQSRKRERRMEGHDDGHPRAEEQAGDNVNAFLPQGFEDDPNEALNTLRAKVNELGYQLAYAGRTFGAPVTERSYYIVDPEAREPIDAFQNGTVELTLLDVYLWSEQRLKK